MPETGLFGLHLHFPAAALLFAPTLFVQISRQGKTENRSHLYCKHVSFKSKTIFIVFAQF